MKDPADYLTNFRVLIIDDESEIIALLRSILLEMGIQHITDVPNGSEAKKFICIHPYADLVICDWNMPLLNGLELLEQIRSTYPKLYFLMLTSRHDQNSIDQAMHAGANDYLTKPFTPEQLETKIKIFLSQSLL